MQLEETSLKAMPLVHIRSILANAFTSAKGSRLNLGVTLLLLALAALFMSGGLPPWRVAAPMEDVLVYPPWRQYYPDLDSPFHGGDILLQQLPWRHWAQNELSAGRFPIWASSPFGGMPLFANAQSSVLYPLHLLWILMPVGAGAGIIMTLKLWLAALGMWIFLRALKLRAPAAFIGAVAFMFSSAMVNWLPWNLSGIILLLPWAAWAVYAWWALGSRPALPALAIIVASAIFAGHPETLFLLSITTTIWFLSLMLTVRVSPNQYLTKVAGLVAAVVGGSLLGMIQLLPFLEALSLSHQALARGNPTDASAHFHPSPDYLLGWLVPRSAGYIPDRVLPVRPFGFTEGVGYVGLVPLAGVILALIAIVRRKLFARLVVPWLVIGILAFVITYDDTVGYLIRKLPIFNQSLNVRWILIVQFAVAILGALGWHWWLTEGVERFAAKASRRSTMLLRGVGAVSALLGAAVPALFALHLVPAPAMERAGPWWQINSSYLLYWGLWAAGISLLLLGLITLWVSRLFPAPYVCGALLLLLIVDLWVQLEPVNGNAPASQYYPQTSFLQQVESIVPPTERIMVAGDVLPANTSLIYGIRDWRSSDPMMSDRAYNAMLLVDPTLLQDPGATYMAFLRDVRRELPPLLGMQYYIFPSSMNPNNLLTEGEPTYRRLAFKDGLGLWQAEGVPGFAYLSDRVDAVGNESGAYAWLKSAGWQTARSYSAVVEAAPAYILAIKPTAGGASPGSTKVLAYTPGHIVVLANSARTALLVVAESWYPGWTVKLDGQSVPDLRTNYLSQGVVVPAGAHTVEFTYSSEAFSTGLALSVAGVISILLLAVWAFLPRIRRRHTISVEPIAGYGGSKSE